MAYDLSKLGDVNTERLIPHGSEVQAVLAEPASAKSTPKGSPFVECVYKVRGGPFDNWTLKLPIWTSQTVKEGKSGSAWDMAERTLAEMYRSYVYMPEATYERGKETPESAAKRAPYKAKMNAFFGIVPDDASLARKVSQFVGKTTTLRVIVKPDLKGVPRNEVGGFVPTTVVTPA